jgi:hypothetical protein
MKSMGKLLVGMSVTLVAFLVFITGYDIARRRWADAVYFGIMAIWWLAIGVFITINEAKSAQLDRDFERIKGRLDSELGDLLEELKDKVSESSHKAKLTNTMTEIIDEVTGGNRPPTEAEVTDIQAKFLEKTDHYLRLTLKQGGMQVEISEEPFKDKSTNQASKDTNKKG